MGDQEKYYAEECQPFERNAHPHYIIQSIFNLPFCLVQLLLSQQPTHYLDQLTRAPSQSCTA